MGQSQLDARQVVFIAGMKGPQRDPAKVEKRLENYPKYEATLDSLIRAKIFLRSSRPRNSPSSCRRTS